MNIPKWLKSYIKEEELSKVEETVAQAESKTAGEVVPMIVKQSSTVGHVPLIMALALVSSFFALDVYDVQKEYLDWPTWVLVSLDLILLVVFTRGLSSINILQRILTPAQDQIEQVEQRALVEFYNHRLHHTEQATGILIFVSLLEHRAVVLGDQPIAEKLPKEKWQEVVGQLIEGIKSKEMATGLNKAIAMSGDILAEHFPIAEGDVNELANHLVIKE